MGLSQRLPHKAAIGRVGLWFACLVLISPLAAAYDGSQLVFHSWKKFCFHGPTNVDEKACLTGLDVQKPSGMPVATLMVISADSPPPKPVLRITVPLSTDSNVVFYPDLKQGVMIAFDQGQPRRLQYTTCYLIGCLAEMEIDPTLIRTLSDAHQIHLRAPRLMGQEALDITIPSEGFGPTYNAPYEFKAAEDEWKKQQEAHERDLARRGMPARKPIPGSSPLSSYPAIEQCLSLCLAMPRR